MTARSWVVAAATLAGLTACGPSAPPADEARNPPAAPAAQEPPVALNSNSPIQYPPRLYDRGVEGDVVLRLFVDSTGRVLPESSRVAESSGYPGLDSAALAGAKKLRFAPARRRGVPVAAAFLQPVEFRHTQPAPQEDPGAAAQ
jgi:protein TonB